MRVERFHSRDFLPIADLAEELLRSYALEDGRVCDEERLRMILHSTVVGSKRQASIFASLALTSSR